MKKIQRETDSLVELLKEQIEIENNIASLPRGYISVKQISGHVYNYRQWREGNKILSEYIPDAFINSIKRKIAQRKEQEKLLKMVKKDIKIVANKLIKSKAITYDELNELIEKVEKENR